MISSPSVIDESPQGGALGLLVRPQIRPDEWWTGFIARTLQVNGIRPKTICWESRMLVRDLVSGPVIRSHRVGNWDDFDLLSFGRYLLPSVCVRCEDNPVAICHSCFADSGHIKMTWRLRTTRVCSVHRTVLNDRCPSCARRWRAVDISRGSCSCGFNLGCTDHQRFAEPHELLGSATDFDATILYDSWRYVPECVQGDPSSRKVAFACLWSYSIHRLNIEPLSAFVGPRLTELLSSQLFSEWRSTGAFSVWQLLPCDQLSTEAAAKLLEILSEVKAAPGHAFSLLGALPVAKWIGELESWISIKTRDIDWDDKQIKNKAMTQCMVDAGIRVLGTYLPSSNSVEEPLNHLLRHLQEVSIPRLPKAGTFVSFTSREMSFDFLDRAMESLWHGIFTQDFWVFTDNTSPGLSRYYLDRHTYWQWRRLSGTLYGDDKSALYVRDLHGCAHKRQPPPRKLIRRRGTTRSASRQVVRPINIDQIDLFGD